MPIIDWNATATWNASYNIGTGSFSPSAEVRLSYHRAVLWPEAQIRAQKFVEILSITTEDRVAIIGCGFGWTVEALVAMGYAAAGTDVSSYIQGNKSTTEDTDYNARITAAGLNPASGDGLTIKAELVARGGGPGNRSRATVANEDLANNASRSRVRQLFAGNKVTVAISEDLLPWLTDAEITTQVSRVAQLDSSNLRIIAHFLTPAQPGNFAAYNWKTAAEWRAFLNSLGASSHLIIIAGTYEVL
jgi:hypothetical protein